MRPAGKAVLLIALSWLAVACSRSPAPPAEPAETAEGPVVGGPPESPGQAPLPPAAPQGDPCGIPGVQLAHCPQATRNFHSALVTVHGWRGSCASTFGEQQGSLYGILGKRKFYDWDCFQYDSLHVPIAENVRRLREQLRLLKEAGYRQVLLATHSTGGVLALDLLAREFQAGPPAEDLPRIAAVMAWATPINGLRSLTSGAGVVLARFGFSPETLPDLRPGSSYLKDLKTRLGQCNRRYLEAQGADRGKLEFRVWFLQGQGEDMVVEPIVPAVATQEGWYVSDRDRLVDTREGHSHNVGDAGTEPVPRYPAEILDFGALLRLPIDPRYGEVFPEDVASVPQSLESRQAEVVDGLTYFAEQNFTGAFTPSLAFLRRMYQGSFARSRTVDERLVDGFLDLLKQKAGNPDEDLVRFFVSFVNEVLLGYDPASGPDVRLVGHGTPHVAQAILETAEVMRQAVAAYLLDHPDSTPVLAPFGGIDAFNAGVVTFLAKFLGSPHDPVQGRALATLDTALPGLPDPVVLASGAVPRLNDYYLGGAYRNLPADAKATVSRLYTNLVARGPEIQTPTLAALNARVSYRGSEQPAWVALDDATVRSVLATIEPEAEGSSREQMRFAAEVAARAGATGTDTKAAREAIQVGEEILDNTEDRRLRRELETELTRGVDRSDYPEVKRSYEPPPK
jgi:pimeloyl-ACP methyl ester carboxylesterase